MECYALLVLKKLESKSVTMHLTSTPITFISTSHTVLCAQKNEGRGGRGVHALAHPANKEQWKHHKTKQYLEYSIVCIHEIVICAVAVETPQHDTRGDPRDSRLRKLLTLLRILMIWSSQKRF
mgnify:CR=1 FL=1